MKILFNFIIRELSSLSVRWLGSHRSKCQNLNFNLHPPTPIPLPALINHVGSWAALFIDSQGFLCAEINLRSPESL